MRGPATLAALLLAASCAAPAPAPSATASPSAAPSARATEGLGTQARPLVMAFAPSPEPARVTAVARAVATSLEKASGLKWDVRVPGSYAAAVDGLCSGELDVAWLDPLGFALAVRRNCGDLGAAAVRPDEAGQLSTTYRGQIVVRTDSGISALAQLRGKRFAFGAPGSGSGTLFAALKIKQDTGQDPKTFFSGTIFAGTDEKAVLAVYQGSVAAGASFLDARALLLKQFPDIMERTRRIATFGPVPNDAVALRSALPADLKTKVRSSLLAYAKTDEGARALKSLYGIDGLDKADPRSYEPIGEAAATLGIDLRREAAATPTPLPSASP